MTKKKITGVIVAVLLAAVGTGVLVLYVRAAEERAFAGEVMVDVLVADAPIPKGTRGGQLAGLVREEQVPSKVRVNGAVSDREALADLADKVALVDVVAGEQLVAARFGTKTELAAQGDVEVPDGLLQVTVGLEPQRALGGQLQPGQTVAVLSSFDPFDVEGAIAVDGEEVAKKTPNTTHVILHKVLVTNVRLEGGVLPTAEEEDPTDSPQTPTGTLLVTLAIDAPSVERVVFTAEHGFLWLAAEPETAPEDGTKIQTRGTVYE